MCLKIMLLQVCIVTFQTRVTRFRKCTDTSISYHKSLSFLYYSELETWVCMYYPAHVHVATHSLHFSDDSLQSMVLQLYSSILCIWAYIKLEVGYSHNETILHTQKHFKFSTKFIDKHAFARESFNYCCDYIIKILITCFIFLSDCHDLSLTILPHSLKVGL